MKRALIAAGLLFVAGLLATPAQAQTGTARGKVLDAQGQPIADAKVTIDFQGGITRKFETKTNKKGEYMQVGMQPGPYRVTASKDGYQPAAQDTRINLGDPTQVPDFKLPTVAQAAQAPGSPQAELRGAFQKAVELQTAGKVDEAEAAYKAILEKAPDVPEVYQNLGSVLAQKKDFTGAEAAFLKALELRPDSADVSTQLAKLYQENGHADKAMAIMEKSAGANPADAKAQFNRGIFLLNAYKNEEAAAAFEAALKADPNMAEAYFRLGAIMVGQGKVPEAIQNLEKYLSLNPTDAQNVATAQGLLKALKK
ncbi:MAG TPA: tetratricopeptide repeat protein [Vicinamibacteria bacterium]|nr:tetratricopeptide repeat protein [Vicinamibacteria bacterium]